MKDVKMVQFLLNSLLTLKKIFLLFKVFNNFIRKAFVLGNGCYTLYNILYNIQYVGRWVALLNSLLRIGVTPKFMHISGRD